MSQQRGSGGGGRGGGGGGGGRGGRGRGRGQPRESQQDEWRQQPPGQSQQREAGQQQQHLRSGAHPHQPSRQEYQQPASQGTSQQPPAQPRGNWGQQQPASQGTSQQPPAQPRGNWGQQQPALQGTSQQPPAQPRAAWGPQQHPGGPSGQQTVQQVPTSSQPQQGSQSYQAFSQPQPSAPHQGGPQQGEASHEQSRGRQGKRQQHGKQQAFQEPPSQQQIPQTPHPSQSSVEGITQGMGDISLLQPTISGPSRGPRGPQPSTQTPSGKGNFGDSLPKRPDAGGSKGRKVRVITNCVTLTLKQSIPFFLYDIKIANEGFVGNIPAPPKGKKPSDGRRKEFKTRKERKAIFARLQATYPQLFGRGLIYDGQAVIFAVLKVPENTYEVELDDDEYPGRRFKLKVTIKETEGGGVLKDLMDFVDPKRDLSQLPQEALRMLNTFFHNALTGGNNAMLSHGRTTVLYNKPLELPNLQGIFCYSEGFNVSVRPQRWNIRLVIDKTQTAFHASGPLPNLITAFLRKRDHYNLNPRELENLSKHLRRLRVEASHFISNEKKPYSRKFTISDMARKMAKDIKIPDLNKSVYDYICDTYPHVRNRISPDSPCIQYGANKSYLPVELCSVVPYQAAPGKDSRIVQEIIRKAAIPAYQRRLQIVGFLNTLISNFNEESSKYMMNNVINIDANLVETEARVLEKRRIRFGGNKEEMVEGEWRLDRQRFLEPAVSEKKNPELKWAIIYTDENPINRNRRAVGDLLQAAQQLGVHVAREPKYCYIYPNEWQKTFDDLIAEKYDFAIIVHSQNDDYGSIKRLGDLDVGIVTQVIKSFTWEKKMNAMTAVNIWLKLNGKLGGVNWDIYLSRPVGHAVKECIMVFGADVTHPSPGSQSSAKSIGISIAAVVASVNLELTKYVAVVGQQPSRAGPETREYIEIITDMKTYTRQLLLHFYQANNGRKPSSIMFYRDGVSEGQFRQVRNNEIMAIQNACQELSDNYKPGITFVIVQKRHNMRLFTNEVGDPNNKYDNKKGNVGPGTVVDTEVCHPREFDFYLNSHKAIQGTSKPAHYHVIWDDNNWGSDDLQDFTYMLCHGYMRCARSVSYPAPTYYAHLAAFRGRAWLGMSDTASSVGENDVPSNRNTNLHERMKKAMFFL